MTPDFFDNDENVKAMRETARTIGLTTLLLDVRREHLNVQAAIDRSAPSAGKSRIPWRPAAVSGPPPAPGGE
jgi:hypothetical protein